MRIAGIILLFGAACLLIAGVATRGWFEQTSTFEKDDSGSFLEMFDDDVGKIETNFGLWSVQTCRDERFTTCTVEDYDPQKHAGGDDEFFAVAKITMVFGILTALFLGVVAFLLIGEKKSARILGTIGAIAGTLALLLGLAVLVLRPKFLSAEDAELGSSVFLYFIGGIGGVVGALLGQRAMALKLMGNKLPAALANESELVDPESMLPKSVIEPGIPGSPRAPISTPVSFPAVEPPPPACGRCGTAAEWAHEYRRYYCASCRTWV